MHKKLFGKINIVPRWIIFLIDMCVCLFSILFAYLLRNNFEVLTIDIQRVSRNVLIVLSLSAISFGLIKTYSGIIRYTSAQDSFRILFSVLMINCSFFILNLFNILIFQKTLISLPTLIINGLTSFLLLITYRVLIKYFFLYIKNIQIDQQKVVIYGAGEAGLAAKRTFDHDRQMNKRIVAFIDDDLQKVGKSIDGIRIIYAAELKNLILKHELDEIIFASYTIPVERKEEVVDLCLEHNIKILNIPPPDFWTNGELKKAQIQKLNIEDLLNRQSIKIDIEGIGEMLNGKRILITGAAGSIGSEIVRQIAKFDIALGVLCDQSESPLHELILELEERQEKRSFHAFIGDVRDKTRMEELFSAFKPHYVFHAAAYKHVPLMESHPIESVKVNVLGTKTIADLALKYNVHKFVMVSTDKAVNPTNVMGTTKRIAEIYVQSLQSQLLQQTPRFINGLSFINQQSKKPVTRFITTRFGNVLGSNGSVIPRFKQQIEKGGPVTVTHPEITRYFMTIPEACRLVLEAGCMGEGGEIFVFDMGKSVKITELAKKMIRLAGLEPNVDIRIEYTGLRPGEKLYEELLNDNENTLPTYHEKIMIGCTREYIYEEIVNDIDRLIEYAQAGKDTQAVIQMKKIVPEFKSKNSVFEKLDKVH